MRQLEERERERDEAKFLCKIQTKDSAVIFKAFQTAGPAGGRGTQNSLDVQKH